MYIAWSIVIASFREMRIPRKWVNSPKSFISNSTASCRLKMAILFSVFAGDKQAVDPNGYGDAKFDVDIEAGVCTRSSKSKLEEEGMDLLVPYACRLL
jgi:hypothetical protein